MTVKEYLSVTDAKEVWFLTGINQWDKFKKQVEKWGGGYWSADIARHLPETISKVFVMSTGVLRIISNTVE